MGGKSQTQRTNSTQSAAPPSWAAPYLQDITSQASQVYNQGPAAQTTQALDMATRTAQGGNPLGLASYTNAANLQQMGGLNNAQRGTLTNLNNEYLTAGNPTSAQTNLAGYASGQNLTGNPYLDKILETTNEGIANRTNGLFGGAGRSFSPAHAAALAKNISAADNQARYTDYDRQVQNQFNANQQIDASNLQRTAQRLGILGQQFGGEQQGVNTMLGIANNGQNIDQNRYLDADALNRVGQQTQNMPWQNLQNYMQSVRGASQGYGTQTGQSETTTPGPSILQQAVGAGMTGLGLASGLGGASSFGGGGKGGGVGGKGLNSGALGAASPGVNGSAFYGPIAP